MVSRAGSAWYGARAVKGGKILVIDDEPMVRTAVGRVLADEGYAVDFAGDGAAAMLKLRDDMPDAILLDLMMPGMNGRQFLHALRYELRSKVPVVVMTAVHGLGQRAISLGATDFVEKPFNVEELLNKVALAVFRARAQPGGDELDRDGAERREDDLGVVVLVDRDLPSLARLDDRLTAQGYSVVALPSVPEGAPRLFRALAPSAIVVAADATSDGGADLSQAVRAMPGLAEVPLVVFTRGPLADGSVDAARKPAAGGWPLDAGSVVALERPSDDDLLRVVELMSGRPVEPIVLEPGHGGPAAARRPE